MKLASWVERSWSGGRAARSIATETMNRFVREFECPECGRRWPASSFPGPMLSIPVLPIHRREDSPEVICEGSEQYALAGREFHDLDEDKTDVVE